MRLRGSSIDRDGGHRSTRHREVLEVGPLEILPEEHLARADGRALMLSIRELRLLTELARRADRIMAREELFRLVWGREMRPGDRSVDVYVRKLRVKLERRCRTWRFIHTHFGFGYRLSAEHATDPQRTVHNWLTPDGSGSAETLRAHQVKEMNLRRRRISAVAIAVAASLGSRHADRAARSSSSSSGAGVGELARARAAERRRPGTINGAGSTLAAPIYQQWGSTLKSPGPDRQLQPGRLGRRHRAAADGHRRLRGQRPGGEARRDQGRARARSRMFPVAFGAITVSYNLSGVKSGLKLDGTTLADIFLGKIKTWNDPDDQVAQPGPEPAEHDDHGRASLRLLRHDEGRSRRSCRPTARRGPGGRSAPTRSSSGRPAPARKGNSGVAAAVKQTAGPSATSSRRTRCRTASPTPP